MIKLKNLNRATLLVNYSFYGNFNTNYSADIYAYYSGNFGYRMIKRHIDGMPCIDIPLS